MQRRPSPRTEGIIRNAGIVMLALSLPFIFIRYLALHLVAPGYARRRDAARREHLDRIRAWQQEELSTLRAKAYRDLDALPPQSELVAPAQFKGERFAIIRAPGDNGGIEIGVAHFMRTMGSFVGRITPSFEMLPDGSIIEPDHEPDD